MKHNDCMDLASPQDWRIGRNPTAGGLALIGEAGGVSHLIAPPGVASHHGEPPGESRGWRYAVWFADAEGLPKAIDVDRPDRVRRVSTKAVVEILPECNRAFVREEMARQIGWAAVSGRREDLSRRVEADARVRAQAEVWFRKELAAAFPGESWYEFQAGASIDEVPDTADELLELVPERALILDDVPSALWKLRAAAQAHLPSQLYGRSRTLMVALLSLRRKLRRSTGPIGDERDERTEVELISS